MKLFPFQEAFKSGSSVCPHRKFLCFNFPKKEISLRSEPSICFWAELFQETLAAESWKHPGLLLPGPGDKQLGSHPGAGDPTETALAPLSALSLMLCPQPYSHVTARALTLQEGIGACNFQPRNRPICGLTYVVHTHTYTHILTHSHTHSHPKALQHKAPVLFILS